MKSQKRHTADRIVISKTIYTPQTFVEALTGHCFHFDGDNIIEKIHQILVDEGIEEKDNELWDYAFDEIEHIAENKIQVVLVDVSGFDHEGNWKVLHRWFEVTGYEHCFLEEECYDEKYRIVDFGDENHLRIPLKEIDCSKLGYFDALEISCWNLVKEYCYYLGLGLISEEENNISFDIAKGIQDHILECFERAGVNFHFGNSEEKIASSERNAVIAIQEVFAKHHILDGYVLTGIRNAHNTKTSWWLSKDGYMHAIYCFSTYGPDYCQQIEVNHQLQNISEYIVILERVLTKTVCAEIPTTPKLTVNKKPSRSFRTCSGNQEGLKV